MLLALVWMVITAAFSVGYYHGDEHYQIIEFAHQKMTGTPTHQLAWEYEEQIRPALQPTMAYGVFSLLETLSVDDPFLHAFALRCLTAMLAVFAIWFFANSAKQFIQPNLWRPFLIASFFLW